MVFIVEESFAGTLEARGFEERLMRLGPPPEHEEVPGQFWKDYIRDTAPVFRRPTIEQLEAFIAPTFQALVDGARYVDDRLLEILEEIDADVVVRTTSSPSRRWPRAAGRGSGSSPATRRSSRTSASRPTFSGYPTDGRGPSWDEYWAEYRRTLGPLHDEFCDFCGQRGRAPASRDRADRHLAVAEPVPLSPRARLPARGRPARDGGWPWSPASAAARSPGSGPIPAMGARSST